MALDLTNWNEGDDLRVLTALGLGISPYKVQTIQGDMNYIALTYPTAVAAILNLLNQYDVAQLSLSSLNRSSEGKTLVKADVLEWEVTGTPTYSPQSEISRVQDQLWLYFDFSALRGSVPSGTAFYRS